MSYVHLQVSSAYSLLSSTASVKQLVTSAKSRGFSALALTDRNVMYGTAAFYKECIAHNIKPIIGLTVDVISEKHVESAFPLVLLAKNGRGFQNLLKLSSAIQTKNKQGIPIKWLKHYADGLFAFTPGYTGEIEQALLTEDIEHAKETTLLFKGIFAQGHFFLSLQKHGIIAEAALNEKLKQLAAQTETKLVATNAVQYTNKEDKFAHKCLAAIKNGITLANIEPDEWESDERYLKSKQEMVELFSDEPEVLENTWAIASACEFQPGEKVAALPKYPLPAGETAAEYLLRLCEQGLLQRYGNPSEIHMERLRYELNVINRMEYSDYFLIVWDFMKYARDNGILTGPGRGSAAGSMVAYALFITDVDPIKYDLLFERFLNPERITMPDIDIDFPDDKREQVIEYVKNKYGELHVAQIITFGTLAAKAALRDVGRVFGLTMKELEQLSKAVPSKLGITLEQSLKESKQLQVFVAESPKNKQIFETASKIEGLPRHASTHAAGVVLSEEPLVQIVPIQQGSEDVYLTQYSMEHLEELGLLKMDFLGLRNLSLLQTILDTIQRQTKRQISIKEVPLNDAAVFELLGKGETTGIFQLESDGMRSVLKRLKPTEFEDIVAVNALYRPGPMENIPLYINRKHGNEKIDYYHPDLQLILEKTYGVIVYQEQIMQIASKMAGFTLGEADLLRRAVSKKQRDVLAAEKVHFVKGALAKGYAESVANEIYELIVRFADYGFNRSHAVAYSMIAYQLAYLKANYPLFFMSSLLTSAVGNEGKMMQYIQELKQMNIKVLPPSINRSHFAFTAEGSNILYSLAAIKGIGASVLKEVFRARRQKKFDDLFDFCLRTSPKIVNRKIIEAFIHAGCLDEFGEDRATLLATIDVALQHAQLVHPDGMEQDDLFGEEGFFFKPKYVQVDQMDAEDKLSLEKKVLGLYLSDHPVSIYEKYKKSLQCKELAEMNQGGKYRTITYITDWKAIRTKKGEPMAFLTLNDESGELEAVAFPAVYKKIQHLLQNEKILFMEGRVDERNGNKQFVIQEAEKVSEKVQSLNRNNHKLFIKIVQEKDTDEIKGRLLDIINQYKGAVPVIIHYVQSGKTIQLNDEYLINPTKECIRSFEELLGTNSAILSD
ncbi:DNA polymerase III subunit alpha [Niallia taxi]|uniref:DNA polymerase III subunit alpha n=1 Tax=Niallia taxi TaxID=2499688 RepID=UPI00254F9800|nr:DNA polymerase III subunit alpha [Niallia taxi]MDK8639389.1 DNA polymerase III subunit alpha [Niallia taxi]